MKKLFQIFNLEKSRTSSLTWSAITIVAISFCFGWKYALVSLFSIVLTYSHSCRLYKEGCFDNVVDEYEHTDGGYPEDGWIKLQKGLKGLSIFLIALGVFLVIIYSLPSIQSASANVRFADASYSVPYASALPFLVGLILFLVLI